MGRNGCVRPCEPRSLFWYFQQARIEWLESLQLGLRDETGPVVLQASCTFFKPVIYPATLTLQTAFRALGKTSMTLEHTLYQAQQLMAEGVCKIVWVDYKRNKSIPLPDIFQILFNEKKP